jgi:hypothetical protein
MTYYGTRFGCRFGQPHNMVRLGENAQQIWEKCNICQHTYHWNKGYKGKVENTKYLKAHVRSFAQVNGATKRVFFKIYYPEKCIINI